MSWHICSLLVILEILTFSDIVRTIKMKFLESLETTNPNIAYVYAITGYACLAVTQIIFKYITLTISPFQALFMRSFSLFCLNSFLLSKTGETPYIK